MLRKLFGYFIEKDANNITDSNELRYLESEQQGFEEDIVLVLDVSGSMDTADYPPNRLEAAKIASFEFVKEKIAKNPLVRIGVVSFSDIGKVASNIVSARDYINPLYSSIRKLRIGGGTDISIGLEYAYNLLQRDSNFNAIRRIILLTDGHGGNPIRLSKDIKSKGIIIQIIGIGGSPNSVNEKLLKKVASIVQGEIQYRFIGDKRALVEHFKNLASNITK